MEIGPSPSARLGSWMVAMEKSCLRPRSSRKGPIQQYLRTSSPIQAGRCTNGRNKTRSATARLAHAADTERQPLGSTIHKKKVEVKPCGTIRKGKWVHLCGVEEFGRGARA